MQTVEVKGLDRVVNTLEQMPDVIRQARTEALEAEGNKLLGIVQAGIGGTGRVAGVQEVYMGSGRGYVAVRAKAKTKLDGYAAGYVTNALEHGHRMAGGHDRVQGKYMYANTQPEAVAAAGRVLAVIEREIKKHMEGEST